jgi:hypothetical protein
MTKGTWSYGCFFHFLIQVPSLSKVVSRYGQIFYPKTKVRTIKYFFISLEQTTFCPVTYILYHNWKIETRPEHITSQNQVNSLEKRDLNIPMIFSF